MMKNKKNSEGYSAINESKNNGQNCYDYFEKYTEKDSTFYMGYVQRWLDYVANNYEHFKGLAEKVDLMPMKAAYTGGSFEALNILEKTGEVETFELELYDEAFH